jgi:hypothetical protein
MLSILSISPRKSAYLHPIMPCIPYVDHTADLREETFKHTYIPPCIPHLSLCPARFTGRQSYILHVTSGADYVGVGPTQPEYYVVRLLFRPRTFMSAIFQQAYSTFYFLLAQTRCGPRSHSTHAHHGSRVAPIMQRSSLHHDSSLHLSCGVLRVHKDMGG